MDQQAEQLLCHAVDAKASQFGKNIFDFWERKVTKSKWKSQHKKVHTTTREVC
jgi:hypothetical protein